MKPRKQHRHKRNRMGRGSDMEKIIIPIAESLVRKPTPIMIEISQSIESLIDGNAQANSQLIFEAKASELSKALLNSLPQGMIEPLIIKLMEAKISVYHKMLGN